MESSKEVAQLLAENSHLEGMVERVRKEQAKAATRTTRQQSSPAMAYRVMPSELAKSDAHAARGARVRQAKRGSLRGRVHAALLAPVQLTFDPQSRFRATWDMLLLLAIAYVAMALPLQARAPRATAPSAPSPLEPHARARRLALQLAFEEHIQDRLGQPVAAALLTVSAVLDVFFICDILVNFRTGFYAEGVLVRDKKLIAQRYVKSVCRSGASPPD